MNYLNNVFIRLFICISLALFSANADAQVSLITNAIDKLEGCRNYSYQYVEKTLDFTNDTTTKQHRDRFQKAPNDETFGYLFRLESKEAGTKYHIIDLYNGQHLTSIAPDDSTYEFVDIKKYAMQHSTSTLPWFLKWLKGRPEKKPSEMAADTSINGAACNHALFHVYDTTINKEHYHTDIDLFINKLSGLPDRITINEKVPLSGSVAKYYISYQYSNYKFNQDAIDISTITAPRGFHPPIRNVALPLLSPGTVAPDWTLYTTDGQKLSLAQLKGKVVLMDFFFIGCVPCMSSLQSLDRIDEKYKNQKFVLVSISDRDGRKVLTGFKKKNNIKNLVCGDAADVAQKYHLPGAPLFYVIDKQGKIASATYGYDDDFESKMTSQIDLLLGK